MKRYYLPPVLVFSKTKAIPITREDESIVGHLVRHHDTEFEQHTSFQFEHYDKRTVRTVGIVPTSWKRLWSTQYTLKAEGEHFTFQEKIGPHFLYFCVQGMWNDQLIQIEERRHRQLVMTCNGEVFVTIRMEEDSFRATFRFLQPIDETCPLFTFMMCIPFFYKMYRKEHDFIEEWSPEEVTSL